MGRYLALLTIIAGCAPVEAAITEPTFETDVTETDADTDADSDADSDADTDADTEPPPPLTWTGTRDFTFDWCQDTVTEEGIEVTTNPAYTDVTGTCGDCDAVFEIVAAPDAICDGYVPISTTIYRGVKWNGAEATIYLISNEQSPGWYREELAVGKVTGGTIAYQYDRSSGRLDYHVEGKATIE